MAQNLAGDEEGIEDLQSWDEDRGVLRRQGKREGFQVVPDT